ncbi:MAG: GIY-YIG nuclease family protein [Candidatus Omnitrophica bacterium]|nr:GIY-YIG nuclease family protein [Candidatus Omnitrophota bacterium]MBU4512149.1 GIY-YIG nuclease family protein [Patescibacteria group bacterium]MCG2693225.1 GIY-YIG nuclease family protein [Candidatus Parcubacteria bacterium]
MQKYYHVYITTNKRHTTLYTGVTNALTGRVWQYKNKIFPGFTKKYNCDKLVYYETFEDINDAIDRERQIKAGSRKKKIGLIESMNPEWRDLYEDLFS